MTDYMMSNSSRSGQDGSMSWVRSNDRTVHTFQEYPQNQPFIYDNYRRDPNRPVKAYPESNRRGQSERIYAMKSNIYMAPLQGVHSEVFSALTYMMFNDVMNEKVWSVCKTTHSKLKVNGGRPTHILVIANKCI